MTLTTVPITLLKIAFLAIMALQLVAGAHYGTTFCGACVVNALLAFSITFDLTSLILNSLDCPNWTHNNISRFNGFDIAFCLLWDGLNISWFGILAVLSDAAVQLFGRWASAIQQHDLWETQDAAGRRTEKLRLP